MTTTKFDCVTTFKRRKRKAHVVVTACNKSDVLPVLRFLYVYPIKSVAIKEIRK